MNEETTRQLRTRITGLRAALKETLGRAKAQDKALAEVLAAAETEDLPALTKAAARLDPGVLKGLGVGDARSLLDELRPLLAGLLTSQRRELARGLREACEAAGRGYGMLTENPPEYRVAPFTVLVEPQTMEASLRYARQEICCLPARPEAILAGAARAEKELTARQDSPEQLFALLFRAYRATLGGAGRGLGQWVELADLLPQLALARQSAGFAKDPQQKRFRAYSRARFLYDLARLRASRRLEQGGLRLDLGTATGDSVRSKARVFYLENPSGEGQYYLTIRFTQVASR